MLNEIIVRSQDGGQGNFNAAPGGGANTGGGMGDGGEKSVVLSIPPDKCGLIIGKGGETIKMVNRQQNY